jgi:Ser/Thr protein kinase RdoA (MazF antagonist)
VPGAQAVTGIDETGGEARVYMVDTDVVCKVQRPPQLRSWTSLEKEVVFLRHLAQAAPDVSVPRVLGYGKDDDVEYTCMTRMAGDAAVRTPIPVEGRVATLQALGRTIRRIHAVPQEPLRESGLFPEEFALPDLRAAVAEDLLDYAGYLDQRGVGWPFPFDLATVTALALEHLPSEPIAVALHTNPGPTHTFVDPTIGAFAGLIDFGDAYIGHPTYDLGRWPNPADREAVLQGYVEAGDPGPHFWDLWEVASVMADLLTIVRHAEGQHTAIQHIITIVQHWAG